MTILPYLGSVETSMKFIRINKKCLEAIKGMRQNPNYKPNDYNSFQKELILFNRIDTIKASAEFIANLPDDVLNLYTFFNTTISTVDSSINRLKRKISYLKVFGSMPDMRSFGSIRSLYLYTSEPFKFDLDVIRNIKSFHRFTIKTSTQNALDNIEQLKLLYQTKLHLTLILSSLDDDSFNTIVDALPTSTIAATTPVAMSQFLFAGKCPILFSNNDLQISSSILTTQKNSVNTLMNLYYPARLDICDQPTNIELLNIKCGGIMLAGMTMLSLPILPLTLTSLTITNCKIQEVDNLPDTLQSITLRSISNLEKIDYPSSVTNLTLDSCQSFTNFTSLTILPLQQLIIGGSMMLRGLQVPNTLTNLVIQKCNRLNTITIPPNTPLIEILLSEIMCIRTIHLPSSVATVRIFNCASLTSVSKLKNLPTLTILPTSNSLECIEISKCKRVQLHNLPTTIKSFSLIENTDLCSLDLSSCFEIELQNCNNLSNILCGPELRSINISHCPECYCTISPSVRGITLIDTIGEYECNHPYLNTLHLQNCQCKNVVLPDDLFNVQISNCNELQSLITSTPDSFPLNFCSSLTSITLKESLYMEVTSCPNLKEVLSDNLCSLRIFQLDEPLTSFECLTSLTLINCNIKSFNTSDMLQVLLLKKCNNITSLPQLPSLKVLGINEATSLSVISLVDGLESLQLKEIPMRTITLPTTLTYLDLSCEKLVNVFKLQECTVLNKLQLFGCMKIEKLILPIHLKSIDIWHFKGIIDSIGLINNPLLQYWNYPTINKKHLEEINCRVEEGVSKVSKQFEFHNTYRLD
ncbi:hypothetical protein QTN25_008858 [Entamoeba marina]